MSQESTNETAGQDNGTLRSLYRDRMALQYNYVNCYAKPIEIMMLRKHYAGKSRVFCPILARPDFIP